MPALGEYAAFISKMKQNPKKPWFGKRWTKRFLNWLDSILFGGAAVGETKTVSSNFCVNFTIGLCVGVAMAICSFFLDEKIIYHVILPYASIFAIANAVWYLTKTLSAFPKIWVKILRCLYVVILAAIAYMIGIYVGVWGVYVVVVFFVFKIILQMVFNDITNQSKKKEPVVEYSGKTEDGERVYKVTNEDGYTTYHKGNEFGNECERTGIGGSTFKEK